MAKGKKEERQDVFEALSKMIYSGRGIIAGVTPGGNSFIGYSLTGRSPSSQARRLVMGDKTGVISTSVTDRQQLEKGNPALLLYPAIIPAKGYILASNGVQTNLLYSTLMSAECDNLNPVDILYESMEERTCMMYDPASDTFIDVACYEPDSPNFTPRISACVNNSDLGFHIVRWGEDGRKVGVVEDGTYQPGVANLIATYEGGNEKPLKPWQGRHLELKVSVSSPKEIAEGLFAAISHEANPGENFAVATAALVFDMKAKEYRSHIVNRF